MCDYNKSIYNLPYTTQFLFYLIISQCEKQKLKMKMFAFQQACFTVAGGHNFGLYLFLPSLLSLAHQTCRCQNSSCWNHCSCRSHRNLDTHQHRARKKTDLTHKQNTTEAGLFVSLHHHNTWKGNKLTWCWPLSTNRSLYIHASECIVLIWLFLLMR